MACVPRLRLTEGLHFHHEGRCCLLCPPPRSSIATVWKGCQASPGGPGLLHLHLQMSLAGLCEVEGPRSLQAPRLPTSNIAFVSHHWQALPSLAVPTGSPAVLLSLSSTLARTGNLRMSRLHHRVKGRILFHYHVVEMPRAGRLGLAITQLSKSASPAASVPQVCILDGLGQVTCPGITPAGRWRISLFT